MMSGFLLYILKANIAVAVFYSFYWLFLRHETFYSCNRAYLLSALALSALFPVFDFSSFFPNAHTFIILNNPEPLILTELTRASGGMSVYDYVTAVILIGASLLFIRLLMQLASLFRLYTVSAKKDGTAKKIVIINESVNPFSFFGWIFINPSLHEKQDMLEIIEHENIHVKQYHSVDILVIETAAAFFWYNPFIWLMRKAMKQNIEFLADRQTIKAGYNKQHYQHNLLKVSQIAKLSAIVNNFRFNDLRKRIVMMNKKQSPAGNLFKYVLIVPVFVCTALLINAQHSNNNANPAALSSAEYGENMQLLPDMTVDDIKELIKQNDKPVIAFDKLTHDFGTIVEANGTVTTVFTFTNLGGKPLVINKVSAACGCTTPEWTKEPVAPGGKGFIKASYNPAGRVAPFEKTMTLHSNAEPNEITLWIKGIVIK